MLYLVPVRSIDIVCEPIHRLAHFVQRMDRIDMIRGDVREKLLMECSVRGSLLGEPSFRAGDVLLLSRSRRFRTSSPAITP